MILDQWIEINEHMKNKFYNQGKIKKISSFTQLEKGMKTNILDLQDNIIYST